MGAHSSFVGAAASRFIGVIVLGTSACTASDGADLTKKGGPPFEIVTTALPDGVTGAPYSADITTANGAGEDYRWRVVAGVVPPGLVLFIEGTPDTTLSGTPTLGTHGTYSFRVEVTDGRRRTAEAVFDLLIRDESLPLELVPLRLPDATAEVPYATMVMARGGVGDYTWRVSDGRLPAGIELGEARPDGFVEIRGTPRTPGLHDFGLEVRDAVETATAAFALEVLPPPPPLRIITENLPSAVDGTSYTTTIAATGGAGDRYTWSIVDGTIPRGVTLRTSGFRSTRLAGTPQGVGRFEFTVRVEDDVGDFDERAFVLDVAEAVVPITIVGATNGLVRLPDAIGGSVYMAQLTARGGQGDYTWSVTADTLPPGLAMATRGTPSTTITGLPLAAGPFVATVTVTDEIGGSDSADVAITVFGPPTLPTIHTSALPDAVICDSYSVWIEASGGANAGYRWSVVAGSLPPRFTLTSTPAGRVYGGTGAVGGTYDFTVQVTDPFGLTDTQAFSIEIAETYGGQRWVAAVGDLETSAKNEIWIEDVCTSTNASPIRVTPAMAPPRGDVRHGELEAGFSPDGRAFAFIGDMTVDGREDVYVVDLRTGTPGLPIRVTAGLALGGQAEPRDLVWSNDGSKLAFGADTRIADAHDVYVVDVTNPAAPQAAVRVSHPTIGRSGSWSRPTHRFSPDGTKLAYASDLAAGHRRLWLVDLSTFSSGGPPGAPQIVHDVPVGSGNLRGGFQFTKDSRAIVYAGNFSTPFTAVWWVDVSGPILGTPVLLGGAAMGCRMNFGPSYGWMIAPDGKKLWALCNDSSSNVALYRSDLSGTLPTPLSPAYGPTLGAGRGIGSARWSPSGDTVAVIENPINSFRQIFLVDLTTTATSTPQPVIPRPTPSGRGSVERLPTHISFSPDGSMLAYLAQSDLLNSDELYLVALRNGRPSSPVKLNTPTTSVREDVVAFQFSPDSNKVAILRRLVGLSELFVVDVSGPSPGPMTRVHPVLQSGGGVLDANSWDGYWDWFWTADSREVVFYGEAHPAARADEAWITNVTGAPPFVARRWTPASPGPANQVFWMYGQGNYSRPFDTWE